MRTRLKAVCIVFLFSLPVFAFAQPEDEYILLAPLPGINDEDSSNPGTQVAIDENTLGEYLSIIYQIGVSIVFIIAVVTLVIGGLQYMTTDSVSSKGGARERISNAFIAILIAVGSYALLFLIGGPGAVSLDLDIESVGTRGGLEPDDSPVSADPIDNTEEITACFAGTDGLGGENDDGAVRLPDPEEVSYFADPARNRTIEYVLVDFRLKNRSECRSLNYNDSVNYFRNNCVGEVIEYTGNYYCVET